MKITNYSGYWTGKIEGTNNGGFTIDLRQIDDRVSGIAKFNEPEFGEYQYFITGNVTTENLFLKMIPDNSSGVLNFGNVDAIGFLDHDGQLSGKWKSSINTEGVFFATRFSVKPRPTSLPNSNSVFIVHGHDDALKQSVARFVEHLGIHPVILQEQINKGMTIIEKFEAFADKAGFAIVLMTPDDIGYPVGNDSEKKPRPRQNVVLELGYFAAKLGRDKTFVLLKGDIEIPSDILGIVYEVIDKNDGWKIRLARELDAAGFEIDLNRAMLQKN